MAFNLFAPDVTLRTKSTKIKVRSTRSIGNSEKLTGIELRLLPPYIIDNNTKPFIFTKGFANLYCLIVVVSDANNQLSGGFDLQGFPRIGDKEYLPINKAIFYWQQTESDTKAPNQIHVLVSIMKSKKGLREVGEILAALKTDNEYKSVLKQIGNLAKNSTPVGAALSMVTDVATIVGKRLSEVEDKPIATIVNSYTALGGEFDKQGIIRKTYKTKKVNFDFDLIVRDAAAEITSKVTTKIDRTARNSSVGNKMVDRRPLEVPEPIEIDLIPLK